MRQSVTEWQRVRLCRRTARVRKRSRVTNYIDIPDDHVWIRSKANPMSRIVSFQLSDGVGIAVSVYRIVLVFVSDSICCVFNSPLHDLKMSTGGSTKRLLLLFLFLLIFFFFFYFSLSLTQFFCLERKEKQIFLNFLNKQTKKNFSVWKTRKIFLTRIVHATEQTSWIDSIGVQYTRAVECVAAENKLENISSQVRTYLILRSI